MSLSLPRTVFPGAGLIVVKAQEGRRLGRNWVLAEIGPGGTGYHAAYTSLQVDVAARLFLLSGDARALRLANMEINMLLPQVKPTMMLDTSNRTRHTEPDRQVGFIDAAAAVLATFGSRADPLPLAAADVAAELRWYKWGPVYNPVFRRALGNSVSRRDARGGELHAHGHDCQPVGAPPATSPRAPLRLRGARAAPATPPASAPHNLPRPRGH